MKKIIYGYARISTRKQNLSRQVDNITRAYPNAIVIQEAYTGTTTDRPKWVGLVGRVQEGDTIVFDEVSRMSRNATEGFEVYQQLFEKGVKLVFLKEPHLNTDVYKEALHNQIQMTGNEIADEYIKATNVVLMILARKQIQLAFDQAQAEVDYLHQRTAEGIRQARQEGKQIGRAVGQKVTTKKGIKTLETIMKTSKDFGGTMADVELIDLLGVDRHTYYKYKAIAKETKANE